MLGVPGVAQFRLSCAGKLIDAKPPLRPSHVWTIRTKLVRQKKTGSRFELTDQTRQAIDEYFG